MKRATLVSAALAGILSLTIQPAYAQATPASSDQGRQMSVSEIYRDNEAVKNELTRMVEEYHNKANDSQYTAQQRSDSKEIAETLSALQERMNISQPQDRSNNSDLGIFAAGILAWFNSQGYKLSAELFAHAMANRARGSAFSPTNGSRIRSSNVIKRIDRNKNASGSAEFPNSGNTEQRDLYYAIHLFTWKTNRGILTLTDTYDFERDKNFPPSPQGAATNIAYIMQLRGYLTPYTVVITY